MEGRKAWSINKIGNEWVAQEMDTNAGEMADNLLDGIWWLLSIVFWPITLTIKLFKHISKRRMN